VKTAPITNQHELIRFCYEALRHPANRERTVLITNTLLRNTGLGEAVAVPEVSGVVDMFTNSPAILRFVVRLSHYTGWLFTMTADGRRGVARVTRVLV
jgi:hypothetical protein